jgi:hypothetical protein
MGVKRQRGKGRVGHLVLVRATGVGKEKKEDIMKVWETEITQAT